MEKILQFLLPIPALLLTFPASGEAAYPKAEPGENIVTFRFVPGDDMFYTPWEGNDGELERLCVLVEQYRAEITSGTVPIYVDAYTSSVRDGKRNLDLSFIRANRVKSELILQKGLSEDNFITKNYAAPYSDPAGTVHKDIVVVTMRIPPEPEPEPEPATQPAVQEPEPVVVEEEEPQEVESPFARVEPQPMPEPAPSSEHAGFYLRTNLLYDALLTPTIGLEWRVNDHVGIKVDGSWAHWGSTHGRVQKMWLVSPEVRWYLLDAKRFCVGLGANFGEANIYKGIASVLSSDTGYQGNLYGGGVTVGYNLALNKCLSMDFNIGLGVTHFSYDTFTVTGGYRVYHGRDLSKNFWGPTQAGVSLLWRIAGNKNK
ncbi:MAG: DUF3575 domain-containing protein [Alistipes sp.]|nr:DUF3575 domain-containing protein [Alistipes sp.]